MVGRTRRRCSELLMVGLACIHGTAQAQQQAIIGAIRCSTDFKKSNAATSNSDSVAIVNQIDRAANSLRSLGIGNAKITEALQTALPKNCNVAVVPKPDEITDSNQKGFYKINFTPAKNTEYMKQSKESIDKDTCDRAVILNLSDACNRKAYELYRINSQPIDYATLSEILSGGVDKRIARVSNGAVLRLGLFVLAGIVAAYKSISDAESERKRAEAEILKARTDAARAAAQQRASEAQARVAEMKQIEQEAKNYSDYVVSLIKIKNAEIAAARAEQARNEEIARQELAKTSDPNNTQPKGELINNAQLAEENAKRAREVAEQKEREKAALEKQQKDKKNYSLESIMKKYGEYRQKLADEVAKCSASKKNMNVDRSLPQPPISPKTIIDMMGANFSNGPSSLGGKAPVSGTEIKGNVPARSQPFNPPWENNSNDIIRPKIEEVCKLEDVNKALDNLFVQLRSLNPIYLENNLNRRQDVKSEFFKVDCSQPATRRILLGKDASSRQACLQIKIDELGLDGLTSQERFWYGYDKASATGCKEILTGFVLGKYSPYKQGDKCTPIDGDSKPPSNGLMEPEWKKWTKPPQPIPGTRQSPQQKPASSGTKPSGSSNPPLQPKPLQKP